MGDERLAKMSRNVMGKGTEKGRNRKRRTALRETWTEWETKSNRKKHVQNVDRERSERNLDPDDKDANGQQPQYAS